MRAADDSIYISPPAPFPPSKHISRVFPTIFKLKYGAAAGAPPFFLRSFCLGFGQCDSIKITYRRSLKPHCLGGRNMVLAFILGPRQLWKVIERE